MSLVKTWITIGPPDSRGTYSKQRIFCKVAKMEVTLTAQSNGVIICSNWKKCKDHMRGGLRPCPVVAAEIILLRLREDKQIKFVSEKASLLEKIRGLNSHLR